MSTATREHTEESMKSTSNADYELGALERNLEAQERIQNATLFIQCIFPTRNDPQTEEFFISIKTPQ